VVYECLFKACKKGVKKREERAVKSMLNAKEGVRLRLRLR